MRKDLHMSTGKLLAQVMHCAEAYWTSKIRKGNLYRTNDGQYRGAGGFGSTGLGK